jgi:hypothetical protein
MIANKIASLSPVKLVNGILTLILNDKTKPKPIICYESMVNSVVPTTNDSEETSFLITTTRGSILCEKVVYATNAYTSILLPSLENIIKPLRGQCIL